MVEHDYVFAEGLGKITFFGNINAYEKAGWTPIWETFKEFGTEERPQFRVLVKKPKEYRDQ